MISEDSMAQRLTNVFKQMHAHMDARIKASQKVKVGFRRFRDGAVAPTQGTIHAAGFDLYAWLDTPCICGGDCDTPTPSPLTIPAGDMAKIKTGINLRIPAGYEVQVRPRSGLAAKHQVTVMNSPGTVDADYDGDGPEFELVVLLKNSGAKPFDVTHGMRIAQMVVKPLPTVTLVEEFGDNKNRLTSDREGGLGSTGVQ